MTEALDGSMEGEDTSMFQNQEFLARATSCTREAVANFQEEERAWQESLRLEGSTRTASVAIVGAGVVGLSVALQLHDLGYRVTVFHDRPLLDGTSITAAGLIEPVAPPEDPASQQLVLDSFRRSFQTYAASVRTQPREIVMLRQVSGYWRVPAPEPMWSDIVDNYQVLSSGDFPDDGFTWGERFLTFVVDPRAWISWRASYLSTNGVGFAMRHFDSPTELAGDYDVIVNATGLYAAEFVNDPSMFRSDGYVLTVPRPSKFEEAIFDWDYPDEIIVFRYAIARAHEVVLGGTQIEREYEEGEAPPDFELAKAIHQAVGELVPSLANLPVETSRVCSRPMRAAIRLEHEWFGSTLLVHCYGTGGSGWTLAPGLARFATELLAEHVPPPRA
jgi:D-amino-acid oxidase